LNQRTGDSKGSSPKNQIRATPSPKACGKFIFQNPPHPKYKRHLPISEKPQADKPLKPEAQKFLIKFQGIGTPRSK